MQSLETFGTLRVEAARRPVERAFWTDLLARLPEPAGFQHDDVGADGADVRSTVTLDLGTDLAERLRRISRDDDEALRTLVLVGVLTVLRRHVRQDDVAVAITPAVPTLTQALVVPATCGPTTTLRSALADVGDAVRAALVHSDFPVELAGPAVSSLEPSERHPFAAVLLTGVGSQDAVGHDDTRFPLVVHTVRTAHGLSLGATFGSRSLHEVSAARILRHVREALVSSTASPDAPLRTIDLTDQADAAVVATANDTVVPFDAEARLEDHLRQQAATRPHAVAVVTDEGSLTYAELDARSDALAARLLAAGLVREELVAVSAERSPEMLVGIYAVLKAGGAYVPVDPGYPQERIRFLLEDSGARIVLARGSRVAELQGRGAVVLDLDPQPGEDRERRPFVRPQGLTSRDLAYVIYTSGSTGTPKGVEVEHRSVVNRIAWMQGAYPIGPQDVIVQKTPVSFDVSVWELFWWSFVGASVCLPAPGVEKDPERLVAAIERHRATTLHFVPSMLGAFLGDVRRSGQVARLSTLRRVFASGEALGRHHVEAFSTVFDGHAGTAELVNLYGPTEATVDVTHHRCDPAEHGPVPIGRPIDNTRIHIADEDLRPQPVGVPGELLIAGVGLARGYLGRAELTAERFVATQDEAVAYRTGDLARWRDDGSIEYLGRIDQQVKVRGYRIELGEIEETLRRETSAAEAVVVPRTAPDGQVVLWAYLTQPATQDVQEVRAALARVLPEHMVPPHVVVLDALPLTPSGKLDRRALPTEIAGAPYVAPRDEVEERLAAIWADVLGVAQVGVDDNFFALGGNSIHFVTVLARSRAAGVTFTFQDLFRHPSVGALCAFVAERPDVDVAAEDVVREQFSALSAADAARLPDGVVDAYPMTQLQAGLVFESELGKSAAEYHDILSYVFASPLSVPVFEEAVRVLVARTPIFRTSYRLDGFSQSLQLVHAEASSPLRVDDVRHLTPDEQEVWYRDWVEREKADPFLWTEPGLVRIHLHLLGDGLFRYGISQHNSALDGWSITLVHTTLFGIYQRLLAGEPVPEVHVANHLRTYAELERESLARSADREFWAGLLEGAELTRLPRSRTGVDGEQFDVRFHEVELGAGASGRIVALARRLDVPVKNVLMAGHLAALGVLSGRSDVMTGYEHSGRPETDDATRAIGLFLNTVPFRVTVGDGTWAGLVRAVHDAEAALLPARRYPMAQMKRDLGTLEPLFETAFNFTHFYLLRQLDELPGFSVLDVRADSETEFLLRAEFSQHFRTDEVRLSLHHHANVIDDDLVEAFGRAYRAVFDAMTADADAPQDLDGLLGTDREAVVTRRSSTVDVVGRRTVVAPADVAPARPAETAVQRRIAAAWARVLTVDVDTIGLDDNFFRLGGSSLTAMRAVVELAGLVTIADLMRNSGLEALSVVAERNAQPLAEPRPTGVLQHLAGDPSVAELSLVCFPFAGGNAVTFDALARHLCDLLPTLAVFAVEPPGHHAGAGPDDLLSLGEVSRAVVQEIEDSITTPVALWGHCVGSALALETARLLEEEGDGVSHVFVGGKVLHSADEIREGVAAVESMSDGDVVRWLVEESGLTGVDVDDDRFSAFVARVFRHDSTTANRYLTTVVDGADGWRLAAPLTLVYAQDDPLTLEHGTRLPAWSAVSDDVSVHRIPRGGHYFCQSEPEAVARVVVAELQSVVRA